MPRRGLNELYDRPNEIDQHHRDHEKVKRGMPTGVVSIRLLSVCHVSVLSGINFQQITPITQIGNYVSGSGWYPPCKQEVINSPYRPCPPPGLRTPSRTR